MVRAGRLRVPLLLLRLLMSRFVPLHLLGVLVLITGPTSAQTVTLADLTFPVRDGQQLIVDVGSGSVVVETTARGEAEVVVTGRGRNARADFERLRFTADVRDGRLVVRTDPRSNGMRGNQTQFSYTVRIPRRFDAAIDTGSGAVRVGALDGDLSVDTGSGSVRLGDVRGDVSVDTGSGSVDAGRITGALTVDTGSGSVEVAEQNGPARIDTGSGSVSVTLGRVGTLAVDTGSGSVQIGLPRGSDADVAVSGSSVRIDAALAFSGRNERGDAVGRLGRGGAQIAVETGSGAVTLAAR